MNTYEAMFLIASGEAARSREQAVEEIQTILERHGAQILELEKWDERKLCYPIEKHKRGTYLLCYFQSPSEAISGVRRSCQLSETILRDLILRVEKYEPKEVREAAAAASADAPVEVAATEAAQPAQPAEEAAGAENQD